MRRRAARECMEAWDVALLLGLLVSGEANIKADKNALELAP